MNSQAFVASLRNYSILEGVCKRNIKEEKKMK